MKSKVLGVLYTMFIVFVLTVPDYVYAETGECCGKTFCQEHGQSCKEKGYHGVTGATKAKAPAVNVGNKICPVSGQEISQEDDSGMKAATYEHEGKIYNFCCAGCIDAFKKDPQKHIQKVDEEFRAEIKK